MRDSAGEGRAERQLVYVLSAQLSWRIMPRPRRCTRRIPKGERAALARTWPSGFFCLGLVSDGGWVNVAGGRESQCLRKLCLVQLLGMAGERESTCFPGWISSLFLLMWCLFRHGGRAQHGGLLVHPRIPSGRCCGGTAALWD